MHVLVTGGAGYVGAVLVPKLLAADHTVTVLDLYLYGQDVLASVKDHPNLHEMKGDIRDQELLKKLLSAVDAVIHLACISNDPSFELNPLLGKTINYDAFLPLVQIAKDSGVRRFIYASSSSVYGLREEENVTEDLPLKPLTDYSKYKAMCEEVLLKERGTGFTALVLRPATVCGYSPRQRFDLTVNILTNQAVNNRRMTVFGGSQRRPNIHIADITDLYVRTLLESDVLVDGKIFNVGYDNARVGELAELVRDVVGADVSITVSASDDLRSYHISSEKIAREIGFAPKHMVADAVRDLVHAFAQNKFTEPLSNSRYFNIKRMQEVNLV